MLEKIAEILTVARKPILKHPLMAACNLPGTSKYIQRLVEWELLDVYPTVNQKLEGRPTRHRGTYQTSQKGEKFLRLYNALQKFLKINEAKKG